MKTTSGRMGVITIAASLFAAGCATTEEEYVEREHSMTVTEPAGAEARSEFTGQDMVIPLHEEQLKVGKRSVDSGQVTIRKIVTSETVSEPVELRKENVTIERRAAGTETSGALSSSGFGAPFEEGTVTIQLQAEEPVVEKTTVTTGEVVARKNVEWDKQTVQRDLRREDISVGRSAAGGAAIEESAGTEGESSAEPEHEQ